MQQIKPIDETARRMGIAMRNVRAVIHLSTDEASRLLRIMPNDLMEYERGVTPIPKEILEYIFTTGYQMMRFRYLEDRYRAQRRFFRKLKQHIAQIP